MAVSLYLPKDLKQVLETTIEGNSSVSPDYISEVNLAPSVLGRNLVKVGEVSNLPLDFVPLSMPSEHSSGNILNSRSFDYDIVVANDYDVGDQDVIILDIGVTSFKLKFLEVREEGDGSVEETSFIFKVEESVDLDTFNIWTLSKSFKFSSVANSTKRLLGSDIGLIEVGCLEEVVIGDENIYTYFNKGDSTFTISTTKKVSEDLLDSIKSIDLAVSYGDSKSYSNLRVAGKVIYQPSYRTFFPVSTVVAPIPNLRDFLVTREVKPYLGYTVVLKEGEGILLNLEVGTSNSMEIPFFDQPKLFGYSSFRVYYDLTNLLVSSSAFVKTVGSFTGFEIKKVSDNSSVGLITNTNLESAVNFFEEHGIIARFEMTSDRISSAFLRRVDSKDLGSIFVEFESTSNSEIPENIDLEVVNFKELPGDNLRLTFTEEGFVDPVDLSKYRVELSVPTRSEKIRKDLTNIAIYSQKDTKVSYSLINSLNYSAYKDTQVNTILKTTGKNIITDYGFEQNLIKLSSDLTDKLGILSSVSIQEGCLKVSSKTDSKLFLSARTRGSTGTYDLDAFSDTSTLVTDQSSSIQSRSEAIVYTKQSLSTIKEDISMLNIQLDKVSQLSIQPYCYNVLGEKFEEQTSYVFNYSKPTIASMYATSLPFFVYIFKTTNHTNAITLIPRSDSIEGYPMKNTLIWTDEVKTGFRELNGQPSKVLVSVDKGVDVESTFPIVYNSSSNVSGKYVTLNNHGLTGSLYELSATFKLTPKTNIKLTTTNVEGVVEVIICQVDEELKITVGGDSTLLNIEEVEADTKEPEEEVIKLLKISSKSKTLKVKAEGSVSLYKSGVFFKDKNFTYVMLEGVL